MGGSTAPRTATIAVESLRALGDAESAKTTKGTLGVIFNDPSDRLIHR